MDKFVKKRKRTSSETDAGHADKSDFRNDTESAHKKSKSTDLETDTKCKIKWRKILAENLDLSYTLLYERREADTLFEEFEKTLIYNTGDLAKVRVFGKWIDIPRKQVAYGDNGLKYSFSGTTVPALSWIPLLENVRRRVEQASGYEFNFVLINRYNDGRDHIGEHRDDEVDLAPDHPIASLSFGQQRDFVFRHSESRGKKTRDIKPVKIELQHGSLLLMNHPTNTYWYHSLPPRKRQMGVRINMTFRKMRLKS